MPFCIDVQRINKVACNLKYILLNEDKTIALSREGYWDTILSRHGVTNGDIEYFVGYLMYMFFQENYAYNLLTAQSRGEPDLEFINLTDIEEVFYAEVKRAGIDVLLGKCPDQAHEAVRKSIINANTKNKSKLYRPMHLIIFLGMFSRAPVVLNHMYIEGHTLLTDLEAKLTIVRERLKLTNSPSDDRHYTHLTNTKLKLIDALINTKHSLFNYYNELRTIFLAENKIYSKFYLIEFRDNGFSVTDVLSYRSTVIKLFPTDSFYIEKQSS